MKAAHQGRRHDAGTHGRKRSTGRRGGRPTVAVEQRRISLPTCIPSKPPRNIDDPRLAYVYAHARQLQGLRHLPGAVWLFAVSVMTIVAPAARSTSWVNIVLLCAAVAGTKLIANYYTRAFGAAQPAYPDSRRDFWRYVALAVGCLTIFLGILVVARGSGLVTGPLHLDGGLYAGSAALFVAACMLHAQWQTGSYLVRPYSLVVPILVALGGVLVLFPPPLLASSLRLHNVHTLFALWMLPVSLAIITVRILDHLLLARTLHGSRVHGVRSLFGASPV